MDVEGGGSEMVEQLVVETATKCVNHAYIRIRLEIQSNNSHNNGGIGVHQLLILTVMMMVTEKMSHYHRTKRKYCLLHHHHITQRDSDSEDSNA